MLLQPTLAFSNSSSHQATGFCLKRTGWGATMPFQLPFTSFRLGAFATRVETVAIRLEEAIASRLDSKKIFITCHTLAGLFSQPILLRL